MFGTLRLFLAVLVIAAHCELPHHANLGVSAVVVFFILSGYVVTAMVRQTFVGTHGYGEFVVDRALRILPQYWFWLVATLGWIGFFASSRGLVTTRSVAENVLLLPLMFVVYDLKPWISGSVFVSQTWSLSLEFFAYLILPWVLARNSARNLAFAVSFAIAALAAWNILFPYNHGYHLLPGVLFIFLIGSFIFDERPGTGGQPSRTMLCYLAVVGCGVVGNAMRSMDHEWTTEVWLGLLTGVPVVYWLSYKKGGRIDSLCGRLSYGVFLNHNLVLAPIYQYRPFQSKWTIFVVAVLCSVILASISYWLVERPFERRRVAARLRSQASRAVKAAHAP